MISKKKKQTALYISVVIAVCIIILFYFQFPQQLYKAAFIERTMSIAPIFEDIGALREQEGEALAESAHAVATEVKDMEKQKLVNDAKAVDKGMPAERYSRAMELISPEHMSVYRGLADGFERTALNLERGAYEYGFPIPVFPYREHIEEVHALLESRGYDRDKLYFYYEDYLKKVNRDWLEKSTKVQQIIEMADKTEMSLFIPEVEKLFEDRKNIGLMLLRIEAYSAQIMIEELFNEIKDIIIALDNFDSEYVDKRAILYFILDNASFFGYQPDILGDDTAVQRLQRVSISHPEFLAGLELDGKL